jgi:outer membrane protein assembly factor BamD (BamD/ComL family)
MSIAGISGSSFFNYAAQSVHSRMQQARQEFQQLGQDLQSGDLPAAQSDFAALQKLNPKSNSSSSTQNSNSISQDFQQLSHDLQSGNTSAARQDYSKVQKDLQSQAPQMQHHGHQGGGNSSNSSNSTSREITQLLNQLGQSLQSGDTSSAQQAYSTLLQDFQQFGQQNGLTQTTSNSISTSA